MDKLDNFFSSSGIGSKVDYLKDTLGTNAIWINSFFKSGGLYDGNDVEDHKAVDEMLGTLADFDALRKNTKKKGGYKECQFCKKNIIRLPVHTVDINPLIFTHLLKIQLTIYLLYILIWL